MGTSLLQEQPVSPQETAVAPADLQRERDRLKLLLDLTNALVSNLEPRDLLRAISASIRQDMHCNVVGVWRPDAERRHLRQLVMDFPESNGVMKEGLLRPIEGSEIGSVFITGKPFVARTKADITDEWSADIIRAEAIES